MTSNAESLSTLANLRADAAAVRYEGESILNSAEREQRAMTPAEKKKTAELRDRLGTLNADAETLHMQLHDGETSEQTRIRQTAQAVAAVRPFGSLNADGSHGDTQPAARQAAPGASGRRFRDLFGEPRPSAWKSNTEFLNAAQSGLHDERLIGAGGGLMRMQASMANEGVPSAGGFSVPEPLVMELLDASLETEVVRPRADVRAMTSATLKIAGFDSSDSSSTLYGSFAGAWVAEGAEFNLEVPTMRRIELAANKLGILVEVTNELAADGVGYTSELQDAMLKALGWYLDYGFLRGTGAGMPLGVLNSPSLIVVAKEAAQDPATITFGNVADMMNRLHPACLKNAVWLAHPSTRSQLLQMSMSIGVGGVAVPTLTGTRDNYQLLLIPIIFSEKMAVLGQQSDLVLCDLTQYTVGIRREMSLDRSAHVGFTRDTQHFRAIVRADGQARWGSAYTPKSGASLSWAVSLAIRA